MSKRPSFNSMNTLLERAWPFMKREMSKRDRWVDHDDYEEYYDEDSAWGPPPRKYTCHICVVDVPCEDTLRKHKLGKDHMKREKDLEEKRKGEGLVDQTWAESKKPGGHNGRYEASTFGRAELLIFCMS